MIFFSHCFFIIFNGIDCAMSIGKLWVRIGSGLVTRVSFDNCNDVSDFIKACRVEFSALGVAIGGKTDLYLSNNVNEACLDGLLINDLLLQIGDVGSSSKNPLYLHVKKNPASFTGVHFDLYIFRLPV